MKEKEIIELLAKVFADDEGADSLYAYLAEDCSYDSDYSKKHIRSAEKIIESMNAVAEAVRQCEEDCNYSCEVIELSTILKKGVTIDGLRGDSFFDVFEYGFLMYQYHSNNPAAVVYVKFNPAGKINEIELSRNKKWFDVCFYDDIEDSEKDIPYTVKPMTPHDRQVKELRDALGGQRHEYEKLDDNEVYIWRQADVFIKDWLRKQGYRVMESEVFEDCVGYHCLRTGVLYTIYMYASGETGKIKISGEYCAELKERKFSQNFVLVTQLAVERELSDNTYKYHVGFINDAGNKMIELWHPRCTIRINGTPVPHERYKRFTPTVRYPFLRLFIGSKFLMFFPFISKRYDSLRTRARLASA